MSLSNHNKNSMENKVIARMASYNIMYHSHSQLSQGILSCNKENRADSDCLIYLIISKLIGFTAICLWSSFFCEGTALLCRDLSLHREFDKHL